jgi:hypothetical protein
MSLQLHETPPFLAYLSACSTGANKVDDLLDEGLHLMSACQLIGFQRVIGSLWAVSDAHCVGLAKAVYAGIAKSGMSDDPVAQCLRDGVRFLRDGKGSDGSVVREDASRSNMEVDRVTMTIQNPSLTMLCIIGRTARMYTESDSGFDTDEAVTFREGYGAPSIVDRLIHCPYADMSTNTMAHRVSILPFPHHSHEI